MISQIIPIILIFRIVSFQASVWFADAGVGLRASQIQRWRITNRRTKIIGNNVAARAKANRVLVSGEEIEPQIQEDGMDLMNYSEEQYEVSKQTNRQETISISSDSTVVLIPTIGSPISSHALNIQTTQSQPDEGNSLVDLVEDEIKSEIDESYEEAIPQQLKSPNSSDGETNLIFLSISIEYTSTCKSSSIIMKIRPPELQSEKTIKNIASIKYNSKNTTSPSKYSIHAYRQETVVICCEEFNLGDDPQASISLDLQQAISNLTITLTNNTVYHYVIPMPGNDYTLPQSQEKAGKILGLINVTHIAEYPAVDYPLQILQVVGYAQLLINIQQPLAQLLLINSQPSPLTYQTLAYLGYLTFGVVVPQQNQSTYPSRSYFFFLDEPDIMNQLRYQERFMRVGVSPLFILPGHLSLTLVGLLILAQLLTLLYFIIRKKKTTSNFWIQQFIEQIFHGQVSSLFLPFFAQFLYLKKLGTLSYLTQLSLATSGIFIVFILFFHYQVFLSYRAYSKKHNSKARLSTQPSHATGGVQENNSDQLTEHFRAKHSFYLGMNNLRDAQAVYYPWVSLAKKLGIISIYVFLYEYSVVQMPLIILIQLAVTLYRVINRCERYYAHYLLNICNDILLLIVYALIQNEFWYHQASLTQKQHNLQIMMNYWRNQGSLTMPIIIVLVVSTLTTAIVLYTIQFTLWFLKFIKGRQLRRNIGQ